MARTKTQRPAAQPMVTLAEIDEALWWTSHQRDRNAHWHRWIDALLDKRNEIQQGATPSHNQEPQ